MKKKKVNHTATPSKWDIINFFQDYNAEKGFTYGQEHNPGDVLYAVIVYKPDNFYQPYTEQERSYIINNFCGKACFGGMIGNSLVGDCLDGKDNGVRLDAYNWKIERCYFSDKNGKEI